VTCYTGYGLDLKNPGNPAELVRHLIALDRSTGKEVWRASVPSSAEEDPYRGFITQHGYASSSPVADGERVFVLFGKSGLFAYDREGKQLWQANLGTQSDPAKWGDGSSPIVFGDLVIVDAGVLGNRFVGVNKATGQIVWSVEDPSFTNCWSTPTHVQVDGKDQILFQLPKKVMAVDPSEGKTLWSAASPLEDAACGSIVTKDGNAYLMGSRAGHAMAIKCGGSGDVSDTNTLWKTRLQAGICTPLIVGDALYWTTGGIFFAARLADGEYVYKKRLPRIGQPTGGFPNADYSSPIAVGQKIVLFTRSGESYVIAAGDEFRLLAHNPAFEGDTSAFSATPAVSDGELFVRSESNLYCIADLSK
jgi:outer membrane protein assembly factor BamB